MLINRSIPLLGFTTLLILSTVIVNSAAAQQQTRTIGIKITFPAKGQQVSLTNNPLKVSGIASHNGPLDCNVYVIVNDIKPYQRALPTGGHNNTNDFSTWVFNLVPSYTSIKTGINKITSKLACQENNANGGNNSAPLTKFYSVNVTGAPSTTKSLKNSSSVKVSNNSLNTNKTQSSVEKKHLLLSNNTKTSSSIPTTKTNATKTNATKTNATKTNATKTNATKTNATKTNATKTNAIAVNVTKNNATGQTGNGSQPSQITSVSAAALLSTAGIISTHQSDKHTSGTTSTNIGNGQQQGTASKSSSGPPLATTIKTNDNTVKNKGSAAVGKQQSNISTITKADNNNPRSLSVSMHLAKRPVHVGGKENLTLGVTDSNSTHAVAGASVSGSITDPSGASKKLEGITNQKGKVSYSWQVSGANTSGKYKVIMKTSAPGYQNSSISKTFKVIPIPIAISNNSTRAFGLSNINNNNNGTTAKQIASPPTITPTPKIVATPSPTISSSNHNSPLITSKQNSTHLVLQRSANTESGKVYIPSTIGSTISSPTVPPANTFNSESGRVSIPNPAHISNVPANSNKVSVPNPQTNSTKSPINQAISPNQKPQLPNNNDKIPFVIATPMLHITNGTTTPASNELSSTKALELVDRMRVIGFDSGMFGPPSGVSASSSATSIPQKNTVFIPTAK